jgi:hypothetical protein
MIASKLNLKSTRLRHKRFCCVYAYSLLHNIINPMYIQKLRDMVPPPGQNTERVCNQIILLILYHRLVTLLKVIDALYKSLIFLVLLLVSKSSVLGFRYFFVLFYYLHVLHCSNYIHCLYLDPETTAF